MSLFDIICRPLSHKCIFTPCQIPFFCYDLVLNGRLSSPFLFFLAEAIRLIRFLTRRRFPNPDLIVVSLSVEISQNEKELYLKIIRLHNERVPDAEIIEALGCNWDTIREAIKWGLKQNRRFSGAEEILLAIEAKLYCIHELKRRLKELSRGLTEKTAKDAGGDVKECISNVKFYPAAEASLWKLIRDYERDIDELKGLYRLVNEVHPTADKPYIITWDIKLASDGD